MIRYSVLILLLAFLFSCAGVQVDGDHLRQGRQWTVTLANAAGFSQLSAEVHAVLPGADIQPGDEGSDPSYRVIRITCEPVNDLEAGRVRAAIARSPGIIDVNERVF